MLREHVKVRNIKKLYYDVIPETCYQIDIGQYQTYGIQLTESGYKEILHDVSTCEKIVVGLTDLFNRYQLSPVHLKDVVEDLLP